MIGKTLTLEWLLDCSRIFKVDKLCLPFLLDEDFSIWSGSGTKGQHHYGNGGLLQHVYEVATTADMMATFYGLSFDSRMELFVSAVWHDAGKLDDYDLVNGEWASAPHKRNIHHISRSAIEFNIASYEAGHPLGLAFTDRVTHNILSHHGQRAWGSPVAPNTREAWILHLCDNISARVCDVDTNDFLKFK